ncbi:MAG: hypothetical protein AAB116_19185 [Candidatus Poribacteria bacterium]
MDQHEKSMQPKYAEHVVANSTNKLNEIKSPAIIQSGNKPTHTPIHGMSSEKFISELSELTDLSKAEARKCRQQQMEINTQIKKLLESVEPDLAMLETSFSRLLSVPTLPESTSRAYKLLLSGIPTGGDIRAIPTLMKKLDHCDVLSKYESMEALIKAYDKRNWDDSLKDLVLKIGTSYLTNESNSPTTLLNHVLQLQFFDILSDRNLIVDDLKKEIKTLMDETEKTRRFISDKATHCKSELQCETAYLNDLKETERLRVAYRGLLQLLK